MNEFNDFVSQGYWWLSLLGGLHCLGLGLYIRYIYREKNGNQKILGSIFSLMALYFLPVYSPKITLLRQSILSLS